MIGHYIVAVIALATIADATLVVVSGGAVTGLVLPNLALLGGVAILKGILLARLLSRKRSAKYTFFVKSQHSKKFVWPLFLSFRPFN